MSQQATEQAYSHYIGGEWTDDGEGDTFESRNPATGETLATFQRGTADDVDAALEAAEDAQEEWRELSYIDRAEYLWDIYHELRER
ncbi:aldehyde dehydrogenase family protein, partial [Natronorubrum halalkaliphilum]|uniref:aldehyde dehydrogenase family protein n=1 Tax=Natronorubrum halalkaliphilum TaxID=2691917 RepID=UPI001F3FF1E2